METVPGRPKVEENLPNQSTVNKFHLTYLRAGKLRTQKVKIKRPLPTPTQKPTQNTNSEPNVSLKC